MIGRGRTRFRFRFGSVAGESISNGIITETGLFLVQENGGYLLQE